MLGLLLVNPACFDFSSNCKSYAMDVVMRVDWGPVFCKPYTRYLGWLCLVWTCGVNRGFCKWLYQRSTWVFLWWTGELSATRYCCGITLFVVRFHQKYTYIWNRGFCLQGTFVLYRCCVPVYFWKTMGFCCFKEQQNKWLLSGETSLHVLCGPGRRGKVTSFEARATWN